MDSNIEPMPDGELLVSLLTAKMPFGKYKDRRLRDLPVPYLEWFARKGFPSGKLGKQLEFMMEIQLNGLGEVLSVLETNLQLTKQL